MFQYDNERAYTHPFAFFPYTVYIFPNRGLIATAPTKPPQTCNECFGNESKAKLIQCFRFKNKIKLKKKCKKINK